MVDRKDSQEEIKVESPLKSSEDSSNLRKTESGFTDLSSSINQNESYEGYNSVPYNADTANLYYAPAEEQSSTSINPVDDD